MKKENEKTPPAAISNRKARYSYHVLSTFEAGIALKGPEVKSLRDGKASLQDSFARVERGEVFLYNMHINPYGFTHHMDLSPTRTRKLLLHRSEIRKIEGNVQQKGLTIIPLQLYFNKTGIAKVELAVCKGKLAPDKRADIKKHDLQREAARDYRAKTKF